MIGPANIVQPGLIGILDDFCNLRSIGRFGWPMKTME